MSSQPKVLFALPASFDAEEALPGELRRRADSANWLVHHILRKTAYRDTDRYGYVKLVANILRRIMGGHYAGVVKALVDAGWIETAPYYPKVKCTGYRLPQRALSQRCKLVPAQDEGLIRRVLADRKRTREEHRATWLPIHHDMARIQRALTITWDAESILSGLDLGDDTMLCRSVLIGNIRWRIPKFTVSSTGRVFNLLTGLKRELRQAVRLAGEPIAGVDLACAQPASLSCLVRAVSPIDCATYKRVLLGSLNDNPAARGDTVSLPAGVSPAVGRDFCLFEDLVLSGNLYEELIRLCDEADMRPLNPREDVKLYLLRDVIAKRGSYPYPFEDVFARRFPTVYGFVRWVNKGDHARLIRILQRIESWLVVENVSPLLVDKIPFVTLHDAIYSRVRDSQVVVDAFKETFSALGIRLVVKPESPPARVQLPAAKPSAYVLAAV